MGTTNTGRTGDPRIVVEVCEGDLLDQDVAALVNPWNRNFLPIWAVRPAGVSGQLKARTGLAPWVRLRSHGLLRLGAAVVTDGGDLAQDLIHVAGINALWRATEFSVTEACRSAVETAWRAGYPSIAMPLIGGGHGRMSPEEARRLLMATLSGYSAAAGDDHMLVKVVIHPAPLTR